MLTVNGFDGNPFDQRSIESMQGRFITCHYRVAVSGNYVAGGDTLDFTNGGVNSAVPPLGRVIEGIEIKQMAGNNTSFVALAGILAVLGIPGTTANNAWKLKFLQDINSDNNAGAYAGISPASPLADTIELEVTWAR